MNKLKSREGTFKRCQSLARLTILFLSILILNGCGGSNDGEFTAATATQAAGQGNGVNVLVAERFLVASGETRRFNENTTILASEDITVNGQITLDPGVSLTLFSQSQINVSGQIGPSPGVTARMTADARGRVVSAQGMPPSFVVLASPGHNVSGTIQGTQNQDIFVATYGQERSVTISGSVTAGSGDVGTRTTAGGKGADVHIGDAEANTAAVSSLAGLGAFAGDLSSSLPSADEFDLPNQLTITGTIRGGKGGKGFTDGVGVDAIDELGDGDTPLQAVAAAREFRGGDGGPGGDIALAAESYDFDGTVQAGSGGGGGDCGVANGQDGDLEAGQSVVSRTGDGGQGGKTSILDTRNAVPIPRGAARNAEGGTPGASRVGAGNGGPGFDGGDTTIFPGDPGLLGEVEPSSVGLRALDALTLRCQIVLEEGGNGGTGSAQRRGGGDGGEVRIVVPTSLTANSAGSRSFCTLDVIIGNYANGGNGFDGCSVEPPVPGGDGGKRGARLVLTRELQFDPSFAFDTSFNDGDAGNGEGPGEFGSSPGEIDLPPLARSEVLALDINSFQIGQVGVRCATLPFTVDLDPTTSGSQLGLQFDYDAADPNCGELPSIRLSATGEGISVPLDYTLTPRAPVQGSGIELDAVSGSLQPGETDLIAPSFDCQDPGVEQEWDLRVIGETPSGTVIEDFVLFYEGTAITSGPCTTQIVFRNESASGANIQFADDSGNIGPELQIFSGLETTIPETRALDNVTLQYLPAGFFINLGTDVPCGSRAIFTLNPDLSTSVMVEPIP